MLVAAVVCLVVAYVFGWIEFAVPAAALAALFVFAVLMTIGRSAYAITLDLADRRVTVGQRAMGALTVRNFSKRRLLPARIELPVGANVATFALPSLGASGEHDEVFAIPTAKRAVVIVGPVRSARGDALGLVTRRVQWTRPVELFVHPQIAALSGSNAGYLRDLEGQATQVISDNDMSFHALREYIPGDDRRNIHWRSSARLGQLMVRQFEDTRRTHTALGLATDMREYASEADAELAVSLFASLGVQTMLDERDLSTLAGATTLRAGTPPRLLDGCSAITMSSGDLGCADVARRIAREVPDASIAFLFTGGVLDPLELRRAASCFPVGMRVVVVSCEIGAELEARGRGAFSQVRIGALSDLPRALRAVVSS